MPPVPAPMQATVVSIDVRRGRRGARRPAAPRPRVDEDGARRRGGVRRCRRRASPSPSARPSCRATRSSTLDGARGRCRGRARDGRCRSISTTCGPISPRSSSGTTSGSITAGPDAVARRRATGPAHRTRERRRPRRRRAASSSTRRSSSPASAGGARCRSSSSAHRPTVSSVASARSTVTRSIAMSYDYTVLAGTQGMWNHEKKDRLFELAERLRLPVVFFTEGGGGRPGDTDGATRRRARRLAFQLLRAAQRPGAARRHHDRLLLRRERGAARLL